MTESGPLIDRSTALDMSPEEFRRVGHETVDRLADFWAGIRDLPVGYGDDPDRAWGLVGRGKLPETGTDPGRVMQEAFEALAAGSLLNGHPKFFGYITAGATPLGVIAEMLAAGINPNCGGWPLSPVASAIELQSVQWIAELIGYPSDCGGLMCSGGNMANMLGFWAARRAAFGPDVRTAGLAGLKPRVYAPTGTHTWLQKIADLAGVGSENVVYVPTSRDETIDPAELDRLIAADKARGYAPFMVVASGGTVSTGAVDDVAAVHRVCDRHSLWLHVDGAYGAFAACLPDAPTGLKSLALADSVALDPHKWLYAPLEAGCALVKNKQHLYDAFGYRPPYYEFHLEDSDDWCNFYEVGVQNSRGFKALKVWCQLRQAGRSGYIESIEQDVRLAQAMADKVGETPCLELESCRLSIVCYRYVPADVSLKTQEGRDYVNRLNKEILFEVQGGGEAFVSNAVIQGEYFLRACIVNFRTRLSDVLETVELTRSIGERLDASLRGRGAETSHSADHSG